MDCLMTPAVHSIHWRRSERREVYNVSPEVWYRRETLQYKHPWSVLSIGVLISECTNMAFEVSYYQCALLEVGGLQKVSSFQGASLIFDTPIWRSFSFCLCGSVVEGIHTSCTRCPHGGPISPRKSTPGGTPLTSDSTAQDTAGAHRGAKSYIHHSGPTVRHFWDRTEKVFSNPLGSSTWVVIFRRRHPRIWITSRMPVRTAKYTLEDHRLGGN